MLHPFMPFITEEIWQQKKNRKKLIMHETWPDFPNKLSNDDETSKRNKLADRFDTRNSIC